MTVMIPSFFGIPPDVVRLGIWAELKPVEVKLYGVLWHESERHRTRKLSRTDKQMGTLAGVSTRSLRDARIKLQERGLVFYSGKPGTAYVYTLCNPATGKPWPGDPKRPIAYIKRSNQHAAPERRPIAGADHSAPALRRGYARQNVSSVQTTSVQTDAQPEAEFHGVRLSF